MKKKLLTLATCACMATSAFANQDGNPFMTEYTTQFNIPPFDQIKTEHYLPALKAGIDEQNKEIEAIINNPEAPTFENTILALDNSGQTLNKVAYVFFAFTEALSSPELQKVDEEFTPLLTKHSDEISMNDKLFARIKQVYDDRANHNYTTAQLRLIESNYKSFTRNGALLSAEKKEELKALNAELAGLYLDFNKRLLNATNSFTLVVDNEAQLAGLPASSVAVAAEEAKARGMEGKWVFTLHAPSRLPLLQYAQNRELRKKMYEGYINLATEGENDNRPVINKIMQARTKKAALLGFDNFAAYMTDKVMAKTPQAAKDLLMKIWGPAIKQVKKEVSEMQAIVKEEGGKFKIEPWDYYYYAEKVRQKKYALDEDEVRQYFAVDNVVNGIFTMANRLYGVTFRELPNAPKYHPEVKVYEVLDKNGNHVSVFMTDYFPRASKRQGAWMSEFKGACIDEYGNDIRPIIYNVGNFTKPTATTPSLLTLDEVETTFHEFGHGLHGMLTRAKYRSQAGTNVDRDFVELPSQIHEHWALEPELLKTYALHYKTGEPMPDELIKKLQDASTHNQGFATTELAGAALLDLYWNSTNFDGDVDVAAFEAKVAKELKMPKEVQFRYRSTYFKHIFGSDGYAAGYYTYLWAEVLDADGFELFKEKGIFDPATADAFRTNVLEMGGSEDPMKLYINFRGQAPNPDALLRNRGLLK